METRTCIRCGLVKSASMFYEGQGNTCKMCVKARNKTWRQTNPVRYKATRKSWEKDNINLAITRRKNRLRRRYSLTPEKVVALLEKQDYKCAICGVELQSPFDPDPTEGTTKAVIDHSHMDGHVRGALCSACNTGLGQFEDDPKMVKAAYYYLRNDIKQTQLSAIIREEE